MREVVKFSECFVCGDKNSCGLKAKFYVQEDGSVATEYKVEKEFVGYADVLHGGVLATLLDEVMIKAILKDDILAVTASMDVKFKRPVYVDQTIKLRGKVIGSRGRVFKTEGVAEVEGKTVGTATGTYVKAKGELADTLKRSLE